HVRAEAGLAQGRGQRKQVVQQGFATGDHSDACGTPGRFLHQAFHRTDRMSGCVPTFLHVAPRTAYVAASEADEEGGLAGECAFALERGKAFHHGQARAVHGHWGRRDVEVGLVHWGDKKSPHRTEFKKPMDHMSGSDRKGSVILDVPEGYRSKAARPALALWIFRP